MRHRDEFGELLESRGYTIAVEVGVQEGKFSDIVLSKWSGTLYMVDRWCHAEGYKDISNVSDDQHSACMAAAFEVSVRHGGRGYLLKETSARRPRGSTMPPLTLCTSTLITRRPVSLPTSNSGCRRCGRGASSPAMTTSTATSPRGILGCGLPYLSSSVASPKWSPASSGLRGSSR